MLTEGPTDKEADIIGRHFAYCQDLAANGVAHLVGRTQNNDESTIGLCVFQAPDEERARAIMNSDPAIAEGVMTGQLYPFSIALWSQPE
jgi:uncharacterized protein YciI